ncbi:RNA 2',3'-cyclic phosphodiesterase [Desulfosporosinus sp. Sb-LF]|uniref:RNA 2',3'-cyclic phosphodiesterase n=1 Tax=Desulfosporosinus sp. Sb-LF TaxID=2560027 RepID=UPI00107F9501|nr:RNA 2',3'-cyclic phosphodiesterase [Desulfosporosinus sp. Sb-LF]TGE32962.1 RNA 2',3'-cyclic phosphodiesterase [Desulfosporosinus sp. Sb-LF]
MRLFVGIELPDEIKRVLLEFQSELKQLGVKGLWKSAENFHVTLEFLGELEPNSLPTLTETLSKRARNHKPFHLSIEGLGAFPSLKRPHTLWTAISGSLNALHQLRDEIHIELVKNSFVLEERQFKSHITMASRPQFDDIDLSCVRTKKFGEFMVAEVVLFESRASYGKRVYTDLYRTKLL